MLLSIATTAILYGLCFVVTDTAPGGIVRVCSKTGKTLPARELPLNGVSNYDMPQLMIPQSTNESRKEETKKLPEKTKCFLFAMILSTAMSKSRRDAIRSTWMTEIAASPGLPKVIVKFVIGTLSSSPDELQLLEQEQNKFGDLMLMKNLEDSFGNLTRKVLWSFVQIDQSYQFKYLLKADDDTFVRLQILVNELAQREFHTRLYYGFFTGDSKPLIREGDRYSETNWHLCDLYIPYALGGGYILSHDLVSRIVVNADGLKMFNAEDVSVGLWLSAFDVDRKHDVRFDTEYVSRGCRNVHLVSHKQTEKLMREKFANIKKYGKPCRREKQLRRSYTYNWKVPPSRCCRRRKGVP